MAFLSLLPRVQMCIRNVISWQPTKQDILLDLLYVILL